jgi:ubiquinol-cytochrome c reductase cytochrome b subunit
MKKQEEKKNPIINLVKKSLTDLPTPSSISYLWNIGFILGIVLTLQIITGLLISIHYIPETSRAFPSVIHLIRDVNKGWTIRFFHTNGASLFFILIYLHIARGIYFGSPSSKPTVWSSGLTLIVLTIAAAFLGYVLPWGQMSFWGATVITNIFSAIPILGKTLVEWIWGNFSVSQPTLNRFFSLHFITPIAIAATIVIHLIALHENGSSNPSQTQTNIDKIKFNPLFRAKDITSIITTAILLSLLISKRPEMIGDVENLNPANPLVTPIHIQPEWYFLFAYAILRSIPSKLGGVLALAASILILFTPSTKRKKPSKFSPISKTKFWTITAIFAILTWIGANPVEPPYEKIGQITRALYFLSIATICFLKNRTLSLES